MTDSLKYLLYYSVVDLTPIVNISSYIQHVHKNVSVCVYILYVPTGEGRVFI